MSWTSKSQDFTPETAKSTEKGQIGHIRIIQ